MRDEPTDRAAEMLPGIDPLPQPRTTAGPSRYDELFFMLEVLFWDRISDAGEAS
jgi:hypothetical protein